MVRLINSKTNKTSRTINRKVTENNYRYNHHTKLTERQMRLVEQEIKDIPKINTNSDWSNILKLIGFKFYGPDVALIRDKRDLYVAFMYNNIWKCSSTPLYSNGYTVIMNYLTDTKPQYVSAGEVGNLLKNYRCPIGSVVEFISRLVA